MASRILFDTNVLLDGLLRREPWLEASSRAWDAHTSGLIEGFVAAVSFTDLFYVLSKLSGRDNARKAVRACLATFSVAAVDREVLLLADAQPGEDLEDNVQAACALALGLDASVSRDTSGFSEATVPVLSPVQLLENLPRSNQS